MDGLAIHWFELEVTAAQQQAWRAWLSVEERARADRYLNPAHGARYVAAHAQLRWLLARELHCSPAALHFEHGPHGKPYLASRALQFNLSHSGSLALAALHPGRGALQRASDSLGVDIEAERMRNFLGLAQRFFSPSEQAWLATQPEAARAHAFARLWTCKEAWMKADGRGLAVLSEPEVQLQEEGAALHALGRAWWVQELDLAPGYAAAVVMPSPPDAITVDRMLPPPLA